MIDISHRQQLFLTLALVVVLFAFLAKIDYVLGEREYVKGIEYRLPFITIGSHWFWLWIVGYPLFAFIFAFTYYAGASDTERNMWYAIGIFLTVILLAVGQLEDFFWHIVNNLPFPSGDWTVWGWSAENNLCWKLFGTWNSTMHLIWLLCFVLIVVGMWIVILEKT